MHLLELDIGRMLKAFVLTFFSLLLMVSLFTVHAQASTPTPAPSTDEIERLTILVTQLLQKQSATDASTVNTSVIIIGLGMLGITLLQLVSVRTLVRPFLNFIDTNQKERDDALEKAAAAKKREDEAHEILLQRIEADSEKDKSSTRLEIQRTDSIQELARVSKTIVNDVETRTQSAERGEREVGKVNAHFDESVQPLNEGIGDIKNTLKDAIDKLDRVATRENLNEIVEPISKELRSVVQRVGDLEGAIREMIETGEHPAILSTTPPSPEPPSSTS